MPPTHPLFIGSEYAKLVDGARGKGPQGVTMKVASRVLCACWRGPASSPSAFSEPDPTCAAEEVAQEKDYRDEPKRHGRNRQPEHAPASSTHVMIGGEGHEAMVGADVRGSGASGVIDGCWHEARCWLQMNRRAQLAAIEALGGAGSNADPRIRSARAAQPLPQRLATTGMQGPRGPVVPSPPRRNRGLRPKTHRWMATCAIEREA